MLVANRFLSFLLSSLPFSCVNSGAQRSTECGIFNHLDFHNFLLNCNTLSRVRAQGNAPLKLHFSPFCCFSRLKFSPTKFVWKKGQSVQPSLSFKSAVNCSGYVAAMRLQISIHVWSSHTVYLSGDYKEFPPELTLLERQSIVTSWQCFGRSAVDSTEEIKGF